MEFSNINILVVGDLMLDRYIMGTSNRMSPEAPVPVITPIKKFSVPGGAANVALNLASIEVNVRSIGVVGQDKWGTELVNLLNESGIDTSGIIQSKSVPTTLKKRTYLNDKQILRIDEEKILDDSHSLKLKEKIKDVIQDIDMIILSDYNKGVLSDKIISFIISLSKNQKIPIIVDPKKEDFKSYKGATVITPNMNEFSRAVNLKSSDDNSVIASGKEQIEKNQFKYIIITQGKEGMILVGNNIIKKVDGKTIKSPDVTGAGDTVIAVFSAIYCLTQNIEISVKIANNAAAYVVSKPGTIYIPLKNLNKIIGGINES
tara:strand:- start:27738 stop:28688 length:951 start_codon:yes stop_codon:yes gene_type:complete